jgi:hypothetical protein
MKIRSLTPLILGLFVPLVGSAQFLDLDTFQQTGAREVALSGASSSGASLEYLDNSVSGRDDTAMVATISSGSLTPFTRVGDKMTYSFHLSEITATENLFTPLYRVGFRFGDSGSLRYATSTGTGPRIEFGSNADGNPFASGTVHITYEDWTTFDYSAIRFNDGNEMDVTVSLELVAVDGDLFDYEMSVTYVSTINPSVTNSKSYVFTGVEVNQVTQIFHSTNSAGMVEGDAYRVSSASLEFIAASEQLPWWTGFDIVDDAGNVDTGSWMGWMNITNAPWIYNYKANSWMYINESGVDPENGAWTYVIK